ncbi:MAG TPA: HAMP domain-containing sensor histidine kinase, partial [Kofleriaceae bacterium]|nr:HAMP domain-containing sensor histidine kinase [Kofleriaceae bacterium]
LQEADRLKSNFLATVSHELRTPLTSVIGYSEMLLEGLAGTLNAEQGDYVQTVLSKADQLLQLITGILDASLLENGQLDLARRIIVVRELLDAVAATYAPQAQQRNVEIALEVPAVPPLYGDERKIRQVLGNLLANAIKFTDGGGRVRVSVAVGPLSPRNDAGRFGSPAARASSQTWGVRISVADDGIGIPPEKLRHIFEPFFQVDSSSTREYGGTGLGLTLAKRYVEAHGGEIWVDSRLGHGSTFTVSFPAAPDELEAYLARTHAANAT